VPVLSVLCSIAVLDHHLLLPKMQLSRAIPRETRWQGMRQRMLTMVNMCCIRLGFPSWCTGTACCQLMRRCLAGELTLQ
jgi:hypothetical protein